MNTYKAIAVSKQLSKFAFNTRSLLVNCISIHAVHHCSRFLAVFPCGSYKRTTDFDTSKAPRKWRKSSYARVLRRAQTYNFTIPSELC